MPNPAKANRSEAEIDETFDDEFSGERSPPRTIGTNHGIEFFERETEIE